MGSPPFVSSAFTNRDYLAAQALTGLIAGKVDFSVGSQALPDHLATKSYAFADAMMRKSGHLLNAVG